MHDGVGPGAVGRLCAGVQTGVPVAVLDVLRERVHHVPLLRAGETRPPRPHASVLKRSENVSRCDQTG